MTELSKGAMTTTGEIILTGNPSDQLLKQDSNMRKALLYGLIAASFGFVSCSIEDDVISKENGMVLHATVEQPADTRATIDNSADTWNFAFAEGDNISVTNSKRLQEGPCYTFTKKGASFYSEARPTSGGVMWYAYFPSDEIDLTGQSGTMQGIANLYALAGKTDSPTNGRDGLHINMHAEVAILKIENKKGFIHIQVKNSATTFVTGLKAKYGDASFDVTTSTEAKSLFTAKEKGTYYVAVPAGVQISIKDGFNTIKSTGAAGLTAGKYYELEIDRQESFGTGTAKTKHDFDVVWTQLWENGPKFAEYNVYNYWTYEENPEIYGGYYCFGRDINQDPEHEWYNGHSNLSGLDDTATSLWGENWRLPTIDEYIALKDNCTSEWITIDGVNGRIFTGKGDYSANSVFFPAGGFFSVGQINSRGGYGFYWSSTVSDNDKAYQMNISKDGVATGSWERQSGYSVRAVLAE